MTDSWQPIKTAPKDGTEVLLFGPKRRVEDTFYMDCCRFYHGKWPVVYMDDYLEPTHWQSLPDPPSMKDPGDA